MIGTVLMNIPTFFKGRILGDFQPSNFILFPKLERLWNFFWVFQAHTLWSYLDGSKIEESDFRNYKLHKYFLEYIVTGFASVCKVFLRCTVTGMGEK